MNIDIRLALNFPSHHKTLKLVKRTKDPHAPWKLVRLWLYVAKHRPDGVLTGMDADDIELAAGWDGDEGVFVKALVDIHWLDNNESTGVLSCHDWNDHNPWVAEANDRSDQGRFSRLAQVAPAVHRELVKQGVTAISKERYKEIVVKKRGSGGVPLGYPETPHRDTPAPAPIPTPKQQPKEEDDDAAPAVKYMSVSECQQLYVRYLGKINTNQGIAAILQDICHEYPPERIREAFQAAAAAGAQKLIWVTNRLKGPPHGSSRERGSVGAGQIATAQGGKQGDASSPADTGEQDFAGDFPDRSDQWVSSTGAG